MSRPFRYTFILGLVALATALAAVGGWRYARASAPVNGPIILISIDALRADRLPIYGYRQGRTPVVDSLAADGIVFERAYSQIPQTLPAHVSLLTGRLPFETGVRDNVGFVVKDEERTLPDMLRDRGFATGGIVSNYALRKETGVNQGFTFFDADLPPAGPDAAVGGLRRDGEASERIAEQWLDSANTSRLFLFLELSDLHPPDQPVADTTSAYYDAQVTRADAAVGRLIRYLKSHQLYDRSTIILVSGHGEGLGDHGEQQHGLFVYEEALRVPLIIKQAAGEGAGRRVADLVQHVDLAPTILDLAKAPASGSLSGQSLTPLLDGTGRLGRRMIYSESLYARYHFGWSGLTTITDGRYRYIRAPREELYDLEADPKQQNNLAAASPGGPPVPGVIDMLRHELKKFGAAVALPRPATISGVERERLEALGNVGSGSADGGVSNEASIDPKDKFGVVETYRTAVRLGAMRHWFQAIDLLRAALGDDPDRTDLWLQLATFANRAGRDDQAATAYLRIVALQPDHADASLGAAAALLKLGRLDEARQRAGSVVKPEAESSAEEQVRARVLLAEIALVRHDAAAAREEALRAREMDSRLPLPDYVEARLLYDRGHVSEALPFFEQAIDGLNAAHARPMAELHYYAGDTLIRLKQYPEAERELIEELTDFPQNSRASAALATLYRRTGRPDEANETIAALVRVSPTPETYQLAARLHETFGDPRQAAAVRAEGRRLFEPAPQSRSRVSQ